MMTIMMGQRSVEAGQSHREGDAQPLAAWGLGKHVAIITSF
jgi:hypothetical protein